MDIRKLQRAIVDGLEDVKAQDIKVYDTSHLTELFDRVVIASGTSNRQTKALAASVRDTVKEAGGHIVAVEGLETGEWVLVDCGDAVVHILQPQLRLYYNLEEIWGDKPVRMKLAAGARLAKASEPMDEDEDEAPVRTVRRASNLRPALARLPEGMKEPSPPMGHEDTDADAIATIRKPARKSAAKTPAGKTAGTRAAAPRKTAAGTAARKTATKTAAKKAPAKKAPAKTAAAKPAARKRATRSA
ncbi:ribosome silencing factor [Cupriavidus alkaliphilus]|uniref:Ribosomal silencing factor RsfS n=1 Tax=Cupriavidus alkaliphilus TaxID=942866 RepID=A0A1C3UEC2_9BURK|nr:ribosome silencing factor [Cupriavidus alkaliphilus]MBB2919062.1 ribosome-associated protein [Cupriavidus alkaliphilus]MBB3008456.1 ribosome-associated protein [Cupriavidus alkaliphilus]MBB3013451.1 ribosome-associated protein [Cupriavidus alkaliphilus]PVY75582.1 ribosome-associated protein [Cupriavidus alkaliphilus]RAS12049.1 ribosome-associated protein [Cupriavidus alkaliphilus]